MDKTPIKVYEDRVLRTPLSGIQRVLNITPTSRPLSPKDVNVQTPAIFRPKKIQIPDIFSPISKIKNLQTRKKYTLSNDENYEIFEEERAYNAVTSTPIVPKRNRIYHNYLIPTPKTEIKHKTNEKVLVKKEEIDARKTPVIRNNEIGTLYDKCNVRQNNDKKNFAIELQAAMKNKNSMKTNIEQKEDSKPIENINVIQEPQSQGIDKDKDTKDTVPKIKIINASNSFEELKRRFEQVKSRAAETIDKSLLERIPSKSDGNKDTQHNGDNKVKYSEQTSPPMKDILKNESKEISGAKTTHKQNNSDVQKVVKTPNIEKREISICESQEHQTGSNLDFYTALPDLTNAKRTIPLFAINENGETCAHFQKKNDLSGIQSIPQSLNSTSVDFHSNEQSSQNVNSGKKKRLGPSKTKFTSKIPKLNFERDNKVRMPSILIRDEDIDRITYKLNLGNEKTLNSASKERAAIRRQTPVSLTSASRNNPQHETEIQDKGRNVSRIKLMYQTPLETRGRNLYENVESKKSGKKSSKSVPSKRLAFMITRQNKSETEVMKNTSRKEISLKHKTVFRKKMSFRSQVKESSRIKTPHNKILSCGNNTSVQDHSGSSSYANQRQSPKTKSKRSQDLKNNEDIIDPETNKKFKDEDENPVNSTFVIQRSTNSHHCSCTTMGENSPTPQSTLSTNSAKRNQENRNKSAKSSLESLGGCFKFRRKQSFFPSNQNSLKRSYSFIHVSINEDKNTPKSLSIASLSESFSESINKFTDDKSSNSYPSAKSLRKKRKQLQDLTTEYCRRRDQQDERANDYIPSSGEPHGAYPENYGNYNLPTTDELTEPDSLNTVQGNEPSEHRQKLIKIDIENDYQTDDSDHCVVLNDEFYRKANRIANNNQEELMKISEDVRTVEDELIDLSKMHRDIQDDLGTKWMRPNRKASSLSDVSKGNAPVKDDGVDSRIPSRNVEHENEKSSQISKSQLNFSSSNYHRNEEENLCENCLVSKLPSKSPRNPSLPSKSPLNPSLPSKSPRNPSPTNEDQDQAKRDKYRVFLEEQNYRAIQMIESRLSRLEDKMGALHSDIRHLIQIQDRTKGSSIPTQEAPRPPPPPPLPPPPPPSSQMFFYTSTTSHSTSLISTRSQSNPRPKSLRPSITVDDLRSVTLRKVSKDRSQLV